MNSPSTHSNGVQVLESLAWDTMVNVLNDAARFAQFTAERGRSPSINWQAVSDVCHRLAMRMKEVEHLVMACSDLDVCSDAMSELQHGAALVASYEQEAPEEKEHRGIQYRILSVYDRFKWACDALNILGEGQEESIMESDTVFA